MILSTLREIRVPDLGNIDRAAIIEISVQTGQSIHAEDTLITLESDKASMDIPVPYSGIVKELKVKVGDKVGTNDLILILEVQDETHAKPVVQPTSESSAPVLAVEPVASQPIAVSNEDGRESDSEKDLHAGPGVRRLAREFAIDLQQITATGPKGRISKEDLQNFVKARLTQTSTQGFNLPQAPNIDFSQFGSIESKSLSRIKKLTASNLHRNWLLVPHVTQFAEADITELESFRKSQQDYAQQCNTKLTPLVFIMKAVVLALRKFPNFNASLSSDGASLVLKKYIHMGIAVDTSEGLVVPVIRDVNKKGLLELAQELAVVSTRARKQQLSAKDMQGSSFTISSLGGIGGTAFTPIINVPDVAILGVSRAALKPVYQEQRFVPRLLLPLSLSYDHRVIDGAEGARFIQYLTQCLTDIRQWLL